ncbi:hypothetical protein [Rossellomorea aquimaris]|uniref:hypothetical protein n=1 Tax=Rossellomorea aquimaris TaxID=189382 RepID=UPI0007D06E6E|nr:hypothetical protein [Rossellomorea aquimaris]
MKAINQVKDLIYVHKNKDRQYVVSYGISFNEFAEHSPDPLKNLLLIKHQYEHGAFNIHTHLEYVEQEEMKNIMNDGVQNYGDFCWIDFEEEVGVNELNGQEIAELLYMGHVKEPLTPPFYSKLNNRYAYLSHDDGWFNKIYYRDFEDFYYMLGSTVSSKIGSLKSGKSLFGLKKEKSFPSIGKDVIYSFKEKIKEGMVISLEKAILSRGKLEIPIWVIGDYFNMDEMVEDYKQIRKSPANGLLSYDRKTKSWSAFLR